MSIIADPNGSSVPAEGSVVASMWGRSQVIDSALCVVWTGEPGRPEGKR